MTVDQAYQLALQHYQGERPTDAETLNRQILAVQPLHAGALLLLGVITQQSGRHAEAADLLRQFVSRHTTHFGAWFHLGEALRNLGRLDEAVAAYRQTNELQPDFADAHLNLGLVLHAQGQTAPAITAFRRAVQCIPGSAEAHNNLGVVLAQTGCTDEAVDTFRRALALKPDYAEAHNNLGGALNDQGHLLDAITAYRRALDLNPDYAGARDNLGNALMELGRPDEALSAIERALALNPADELARCNYSLLLLRRGDFERGWPFFEARWCQLRAVQRQFAQPMWDGRVVDGQRLLIHAEQGYGDSIQFIRYATLAAARGCHVIVECPKLLAALFRGVPGVSEIVTTRSPLPPFDFHVPMMSQPLVFQTTHESIPREVPYLFVPPEYLEIWRQRVAGDRAPLRVGLCWTGNPQHRRNRKRHMPLETLLPLLAVEGIEFHSLQIGHGSEQVSQCPEAAHLIVHTNEIRDFADTAAILTQLDLIVSVDTAVAHLAGALGRPVWTLLPFVSDWRWGLEREDNPWYPTMRLFRQAQLGDWPGVIERVVAAIRQTRH